MNIRTLLTAAGITAAFLLPGVASAETVAYSAPGTTNVRSGPGTNFPVVARVRGGTEIVVTQCPGSWCAVILPHGRDGWIAASRLADTYAAAPIYRERVVPDYYDYSPAYGYSRGPTIGFQFYGGQRDRHRGWSNDSRGGNADFRPRQGHRDWDNNDGGGNADWRHRRGQDDAQMPDQRNNARTDCKDGMEACVVN